MRRLLAQAALFRDPALHRQPRQQLRSQLLRPPPALAAGRQHMGPLPKRPPQPPQPVRGGRLRDIPQQGIDPRQPQARLQPGEAAQLPRHQRRPFRLREMAGQVPHQVGPGVRPFPLHLGQGPAPDPCRRRRPIHRKVARPPAAALIALAEPLLQREVIEAQGPVALLIGAGPSAQQILDRRQRGLHRHQRALQRRLRFSADRRQGAQGHRLPLLAQQRQQRCHRLVGLAAGEAALEGLAVEGVDPCGQLGQVLRVAQRQSAAGEFGEHPHGVEELAAAPFTEPLGHRLRRQPGRRQPLGQIALPATGEGIGLEVVEVVGPLSIEVARFEGLAQGAEHLIRRRLVASTRSQDGRRAA